MALGIDAAAHDGVLDAQGHTVAVLGCGLSHVYPRQHAALQARILDAGGLLLSEHLPDTKARPEFFPRRNRIITGMSLGVLVVEAMVRSGSLISARLALEQNREVFALPGPPDAATSAGCHQLIQQGAMLVTSPDELIAALEGAWPCGQTLLSSVPHPPAEACPRAVQRSTVKKAEKSACEIEKQQTAPPEIKARELAAAELAAVESAESDMGEVNAPWLALLQHGPLSVDQLVLQSGESVSRVMNAMLMLELVGKAVPQGDGWAAMTLTK